MPKAWCLLRKGHTKVKDEEKKETEIIKKHKWLEDLNPKPSDLWIQKMMTLFARFDKGSSGCVDNEDIESFAARFIKFGMLREERAARMREKIFTFWRVLNKGAKKVNLEEFVKARIPLVLNPEFGTEMWEQNLKQVGILMFCSLDANEDGTISLQEFVLFFKCINVKEIYAREIFARIDTDGNRLMSKDEFVAAFKGFLFSQEDSPSKELFGPLIIAPSVPKEFLGTQAPV